MLEEDEFLKDKLEKVVEFCEKVPLESSSFDKNTFEGNEALKVLKKVFELRDEKACINMGNRLLEAGVIKDVLMVGHFSTQHLFGLTHRLKKEFLPIYLTFNGVKESRRSLKKAIKSSFAGIKEIIVNDVLLFILDRQLNYERHIEDIEEEYEKLYRKYQSLKKMSLQEEIVKRNIENEYLKKRVEELESKLKKVRRRANIGELEKTELTSPSAQISFQKIDIDQEKESSSSSSSTNESSVMESYIEQKKRVEEKEKNELIGGKVDEENKIKKESNNNNKNDNEKPSSLPVKPSPKELEKVIKTSSLSPEAVTKKTDNRNALKLGTNDDDNTSELNPKEKGIQIKELRKKIEEKEKQDLEDEQKIESKLPFSIKFVMIRNIIKWIDDGSVFVKLLLVNKSICNYLSCVMTGQDLEHICFHVHEAKYLPMIAGYSENPIVNVRNKKKDNESNRVVLVERAMLGKEKKMESMTNVFTYVKNLSIHNQILFKDVHLRMFPMCRILNLKKMSMKFKGSGLRHCQELKEIHLMNMDHLRDDPLFRSASPSLEILSITNCGGITGVGFQYLQNLRILNINYSYKIANRALVHLKNCTKLSLINCYSVTGKVLCSMESLKEIYIEGCNRIKQRDIFKCQEKGIVVKEKEEEEDN